MLPPESAEHSHPPTDRGGASAGLDGSGNPITQRIIRVTRRVHHKLSLSVLDVVPMRTDQTTSGALAASLRLALTADRLGPSTCASR